MTEFTEEEMTSRLNDKLEKIKKLTTVVPDENLAKLSLALAEVMQVVLDWRGNETVITRDDASMEFLHAVEKGLGL